MRFRLALVGCFAVVAASAAVPPPAAPPLKREKLPIPPLANLPDDWAINSPRKEIAPRFE